MRRKWMVIVCSLFLVGLCFLPAIAFDTEQTHQGTRGYWYYVGGSGAGNFTRIQDAIDNASGGDTVYVYDNLSPYYEHVMINKSISLLGEHTETTVIDGSNTGDVLWISADDTSVSGFTIRNSIASGIEIYERNFCVISSCVIVNTYAGVSVSSSSENTIIECSLLNNHFGIYLCESDPEDPIERSSNRILWNTIQYNAEGIEFGHGMAGNYANTVWGNNISYNERGMAMIMSFDNNIGYNEFFDNHFIGLSVSMCDGGGDFNTIHQNNFMNGGATQAWDFGGGMNFWDYNFWSDYNGSDEDGDGYGDTSYLLPGDSNAHDHYPLMNHAGWNNQPPNPPTIGGSNQQEAGMMAEYYFRFADPNGDEIFYSIDWGDGTHTGLIGPVYSNDQIMQRHTWSDPENYVLAVRAIDGWNTDSWSSLIVHVLAITPPIIEGPTKGIVDQNYTYNFTAVDPQDHSISYYIDWGDGSNSSWLGWYSSGAQIQVGHLWQKKGNYVIKAKAKDVYGNEGDWGILRISMPTLVTFDSLFLRFFQWFPRAFPLLRFLFRLV